MSLLDLLDPFHREQIRGVFAIGTIASIIAIRDRIDPAMIFLGIKISPLLDVLLFTWISYVFLMALGVSEDMFGKSISRFCVGLARISFFFGIGLILLIVVPSLLLEAYNWLLSAPLEVYAIIFLAFLYAISKARKRAKTAAQVKVSGGVRTTHTTHTKMPGVV